MSGQMALGIVGYAFVVNLLAYAAMAFDKKMAESRSRRVSEATLLNLALIGGSIGTVIAQRTIRHKTRKEPFRSQLGGIILLQTILLAAFLAGLVVTGSPHKLWQVIVSWGG